MRKLLILAILSFALFFTACPEQPGPSSTGAANDANNAASQPAEDASAAVIELEKKAYEASKNKDGKFFEEMLADDFTGVVGGNIDDKAALVKRIAESPCEMKSYEIIDPRTVKLSENAMLVTHKVSFDYTCEGKKVKSPEYTATVYVKEGGAWKGAYHQSVSAANAEGDVGTVADTSGLKGTDDQATQALAELEESAWNAWVSGEMKWFEENMAGNALLVNPSGISNRDEAIKAMSDANCEVDQYQLRGFTGTKLAENVMLLMYRGEQSGKCGDAELPSAVLGSTIAIKEGEKWKGIFHMETPAK
ncbi:MAG: nuclear transport factor 2 family protein [Acidobacteriota bacterium]|nr:MAG: nuclear transport factor 2 family protein [Acidobacteriota bacterium]